MNKIITGILLALLLLTPGLQAEKPEKRSRIEVPVYAHDFGSVNEGTVVSHDFTIKNSGNSEFVIQDIITACGCTVAKSYASVVNPGESTKINVKFDTSGFSGTQTKAIQVLTNDLDKSSVNFKLTGKIDSEVSVSPAKVFLGAVNVSALKKLSPTRVSVKVNSDSKAEITKVSSESKAFRVNEIDSGAKARTFELVFSPDLPVGEVRDRVVISLSGSNKKSINLPVYLNVTKDLVLNPGIVSFGMIAGSSPIQRSVKIDNFSARPIVIESAESADSALDLKLTTLTPGKSYILEISLDPSKVKTDLKSLVTLKTNDTETGALKLNVYGTKAR